MSPLPPPEDVAKRVSAALAYAGIDIKQSQQKIGISPSTMARIVSRSSPRGFKTEAELERIATACEIPNSFLSDGFVRDAPNLAERVEAIEGKVDTLLTALRAARDQGAGRFGDDLVALFAEHSPSRSTQPGSDPPASPTPEPEDSRPARPARAAARP